MLWTGLLLVFPPVCGAQVDRRALSPAQAIHRFDDARDLAVDDQGAVYVLEGETATITIISDRGTTERSLTATDATGEAFSEPEALDPTNGLTIIVADPGRGELQWFSRSFRLLETRALVRSTARQSHRSGYGAAEDELGGGAGRPIAVAATARDEVFAIDENDGIVFRWDPSGRFSGVIGAGGEGRLVDPIDLSAADELLFAADAEQRVVAVYDRFGSYVRRISIGANDWMQAISSFGGRLYLTMPREIIVYTTRGRLIARHPVELDEPLVDCVRTNDALYLLTQTSLYQLPIE